MDLQKVGNDKIDALEEMILNKYESIEFEVKHTFTPGLYSREIFMPTGSLLTSKVHNTEHPYVVLTGVAVVHMPDGGTEVLAAGHSGITKPGTRRALYIEENCRWVTFHVLSENEEEARLDGADDDTLLEMIEKRIIEHRDLPKPKDILEIADSTDEGDSVCHGHL